MTTVIQPDSNLLEPYEMKNKIKVKGKEVVVDDQFYMQKINLKFY